MSDLLEDRNNLLLMEALVSGEAVSVNISELSKILGKHRNTVKNKVEALFEHKILNPPIYPFHGLYRVYPLLAVINMNMPEEEKCANGIVEWIKKDSKIFAAFRTRQGDYDTLLFTYHENITAYQLWMLSIPSVLRIKYGVCENHVNFESSTAYFSNQLIIKYNPSSGIRLIERDFREKGELILKGYSLDEVDVQILRCLVRGRGIKTNTTLLCEKTKLHRKTVEKRIAALQKEGLLGMALCRFPKFFVPPNYLLTYSLVQFKELDEKVLNELIIDVNIPIAIQTIHGKFNMLLFGNHSSLDEHMRWEERFRLMFPENIGSAQIVYLSPEMTINLDQQLVSLCYIREKLGTRETMDLGTIIRQLEKARARVLYNIPKRNIPK